MGMKEEECVLTEDGLDAVIKLQGEKQVEYNYLLGKQIAEVCDYVMVVGRYNREAILKGLQEKNYPEDKVFVADTFADAQARLAQIAQPGDTVLYENDLPDTFK